MYKKIIKIYSKNKFPIKCKHFYTKQFDHINDLHDHVEVYDKLLFEISISLNTLTYRLV